MAVQKLEGNITWYDGKDFTIEGKGWDDTESFYHRLPTRAKKMVNNIVWEISKKSAGISIHFSTNSSSVAVKWNGVRAMDHMTALGVSGLDLYVKHEKKWKWLAVGRPNSEQNKAQLFAGLSSKMRDYMLYLPLYNPVHHVELGIDPSSKIKSTSPRKRKPIVFYGTSITQGGCASRPGMSYPAILGRWLDRPSINLGFSGNGKMQPGVIDLLCELNPAIYVLDNLPNMQADLIKERLGPAILKLRTARPKTPIVLIDNILYCDAYLKLLRKERYESSNMTQYSIYKKLKRRGIKNLYYIKDNDLIGEDGEASVDGVHLTDLGYMRFSEKIIKVLKKLI